LIYLDTSVLLARLFAEGRAPSDAIWARPLVSSRLLEFEVINRIHARSAARSHAADARQLIDRVSLLELAPQVLARALMPFPLPVRTLDALHLATMDFLRTQGQTLELATYDQRLATAGRALGFPLAELG
jgi:predicted nucleic acid-binding protein